MVTVRKEERADLVKGLLDTVIKAILSKRTLCTLTFFAAVHLLSMHPDIETTQQDLARMTSKSPQTSPQLESTAHVSIKTDEAPKSPPRRRKRPHLPTLREELTIRQAQPVQPYTPSLAEIAAFKANVGDVCKAHNKNREAYRFAPLVDKHAIKEWVHSVTPNLYVAKEYAHVDASNVTALTAELLAQFPSQKFMVKAAHTSGCIAAASMKTNTVKCLKPPCFKKAAQPLPKINGTMSMVSRLQHVCQTYLDMDFSTLYGEKQYANIPRRCVLEELLDVAVWSPLYDYKIHTFHGRPAIVVITGDRFGKTGKSTRNARTPYDWKEVPIALKGYGSNPLSDEELGPRPDFLDDMLRDTQTLVQRGIELIGEFPYVRVDYFVYQRAAPKDTNNPPQIAASTAVAGSNNVHHADDDGTLNMSSFEVAFGELTFTHDHCGQIFDPSHPWANLFYGFVGQHPEYNISPSSILDLLEESNNEN